MTKDGCAKLLCAVRARGKRGTNDTGDSKTKHPSLIKIGIIIILMYFLVCSPFSPLSPCFSFLSLLFLSSSLFSDYRPRPDVEPIYGC